MKMSQIKTDTCQPLRMPLHPHVSCFESEHSVEDVCDAGHVLLSEVLAPLEEVHVHLNSPRARDHDACT